MPSTNAKRKPSTDVLYVIFEQHLFNFQDSNEDRKTFVERVVQDYLKFLRKKSLAVPKIWEPEIVEELSAQVTSMLVKKIYGFHSIQEFTAQPAARTSARKAKSRYQRVQKS